MFKQGSTLTFFSFYYRAHLAASRQSVVQSKTNELQELEQRLAAAERRRAEVSRGVHTIPRSDYAY